MSKFPALAILVMLPACAATPLVPVEVGTFTAPALKQAVQNVRVVQNPDTGEPTQVVAVLDIHEPSGSQDAALRTMKERAALLGADAVVSVETHHEEASGTMRGIETHLSGVAVKNRRLFANKPYFVLGEVEFDAPMGKEDEGLRGLQAKAAAMNADLVVDVHFHHDESSKDESTHLSGMAIKYK